MRLVVVRHGATQHNLDARFTGQTDAPLSALGLRQAEALALRLMYTRYDAIVASDLSRARVTAEHIANPHRQPVIVDARLREISMGAWEGHPVADVRTRSPELLEQIECDPTGRAHAPDGESWRAFVERVDEALTYWRGRFPDGRLLWVSHGGVMSALLLDALGLSFERRRQFARDNASLMEIDYGNDAPVILRMNDTSHLAGLSDEGAGERFQAL